MIILEKNIREYISYFNSDLDYSTDDLMNSFVKLGIEIEKYSKIWNNSGPIVIGRVVSFETLEGFKKPIRLCKVEIGNGQINEIICGASNFVPNDLVVVALPGAVLVNDFKIEKRETYGHLSNGMICSAKELGIPLENNGIVVLSSECKIGSDFAEEFNLFGQVFDLTTTPDRGYLYSYRGILRDLSLKLDFHFNDDDFISFFTKKYMNKKQYLLDNIVDNIEIKKSNKNLFSFEINDSLINLSDEIIFLLAYSEIYSEDPFESIKNFFNLTFGIPFDYVASEIKLDDIKYEVSNKKAIMEISAEKKIDIYENDVLIKNGKSFIGLAGLFNENKYNFNSKSKFVYFLNTNFDAKSISKTSRRINFATESSKRIERGIDYNFSLEISKILVAFISSSLKLDIKQLFLNSTPSVKKIINYNWYSFERITSLPAKLEIQENIFNKLGIDIINKDDLGILTLSIPTWRNDLNIDEDIVEDLIRIIGYENIKSKVPLSTKNHDFISDSIAEKVYLGLAFNNLVNVLSDPFMDMENINRMNLTENDFRRNAVKIINPLDKRKSFFNTTLIPNLIEIAKRNLDKGNKNLGIYTINEVAFANSKVNFPKFDIGKKIDKSSQEFINKELPTQQNNLAILLTGQEELKNVFNSKPRYYSVFSFQKYLDILKMIFKINLQITDNKEHFMHPGRSAGIKFENKTIGFFGQLHPQVAKNFKLKSEIFILEIDFDSLYMDRKPISPSISDFPKVFQDLSIIIPENISAANIIETILSNSENMISNIMLYDEYIGEPVPVGKKSLTFAIEFQSNDKTLTEEEATIIKNNALLKLEELFDAEIRGKGQF